MKSFRIPSGRVFRFQAAEFSIGNGIPRYRIQGAGIYRGLCIYIYVKYKYIYIYIHICTYLGCGPLPVTVVNKAL